MRQSVIPAVDVVLLTLIEGRLHVVVIDRAKDPREGGKLALPGGFVHPEEDRDCVDAARRILLRKTGITAPYLAQLQTFSGATRDPGGWSISVAYYALVGHEALLRAATEPFRTLPVDDLPELAFDHAEIIDTAVRRVRDKSAYSTLPCYLLPEQFSITQLQHAYEQVSGSPLNKAAFRRKLAELDFIEAVPGAMLTGHRRPTQMYRIRADKKLALFDKAF